MGRSIAGDYTRFAAFSLAVASGECLAGKELPQASRPHLGLNGPLIIALIPLKIPGLGMCI